MYDYYLTKIIGRKRLKWVRFFLMIVPFSSIEALRINHYTVVGNTFNTQFLLTSYRHRYKGIGI